MIYVIQAFLERRAPAGSGLQGLKNDLLSSLKRRYPSVESNLTFACATLLDPRFKATPFKCEEHLERAKLRLLEEMGSMDQEIDEDSGDQNSSDQQSSQPTGSTGTDSSSNRNENKSKGFWSQYKEVFTEAYSNVSDETEVVSALDELNVYLKEKNMDPKHAEKIGNYWAASTFNRLVPLALKYLCVPPSTVSSERLFSSAGNICDVKRNRLDPEKVKMLVFLHKNIDS